MKVVKLNLNMSNQKLHGYYFSSKSLVMTIINVIIHYYLYVVHTKKSLFILFNQNKFNYYLYLLTCNLIGELIISDNLTTFMMTKIIYHFRSIRMCMN